MEQRAAPERRDDGADPIRANIAAVARLERATSRARTHGHRLAGIVTRLAGSGPSILLHALWFTGWILVNLGFFGARPFDPVPFSVLTMVVSLEVIFLTLFVLLNQNQMTAQARKRAHLEFQVTLLAEREMTLVLRMLKEVSDQLGVTSATAGELEALLKQTDVGSLSAKLDAVLEDE
jgi:uncharacterized membrane protein